MTNSIYPCLWFDGNIREAASFYCTVFNNSDFLSDTPLVVNCNGQTGRTYILNEGVSIVVECDTQQEIDNYWDKLTQGGEESMCGWLKDKFDVSRQIVPKVLETLVTDQERFKRVMQALLKMRKLDIDAMVNDIV